MNWKLVVACCAISVMAEAPAGYQHWSADTLRGFDKTLGAKMDPHKIAGAALANYGNHNAGITHREASGEAELHESMADLFVVQAGKATLVVGGEVLEPRTTAPGEIRGTSIHGGVQQPLAPGDIVHIPANTAHQLLLAPGATFTYFVMKVASK